MYILQPLCSSMHIYIHNVVELHFLIACKQTKIYSYIGYNTPKYETHLYITCIYIVK